MPTFYSVKPEQTLELRRGGYGKVKDAVLGEMEVPIKPLKVRFLRLSPPFPVHGMPSKGGLAYGILSPMEGALQIRKNATELGPAADNLPETDEELADWLTQKLSNHPSKGGLFIEVREADEELEGDVMDDKLAPPPGMVTSPVGVIVRDEARGRAYCKVCDFSMRTNGINGHSRSNRHLENLRAYEEEMQKAAGF